MSAAEIFRTPSLGSLVPFPRPPLGALLPETSLEVVFERWTLARQPTDGTLRRYRGGLRRLAAFGIVTVADACDRSLVARFQEERRREEAHCETIRIDVTSATVLLEYLEQIDEIPLGTCSGVNRARRMKGKKIRKSRLTALEGHEVDALLAVAHEWDHLIELAINIVWWAGLRHDEMRVLDVKRHLRFSEPAIYVEGRTKTWAERDVPMESPLKTFLEEYVKKHGLTGPLLPARRQHSHGKNRECISPEALRDGLHKVVELAGFTRLKVDYRLLRRSCAARWIRFGGSAEDPMNELKLTKVMGHSPETSRHYYQAFTPQYDRAFETTKEGKAGTASPVTQVTQHWSEKPTLVLTKKGPGHTTTKVLKGDDLARMQAAERALVKDAHRKKGAR